MDAMKEALRRKMQTMKGGPSVEIEVGKEEDGSKKGSDLAPTLEAEGEGEGEDPMMAEGEQPGIDPELLMQILAALQDHAPGAGREPQGLQERAAVGAREKMQSLQGMKK